jgi:hypothetical protein
MHQLTIKVMPHKAVEQTKSKPDGKLWAGSASLSIH